MTQPSKCYIVDMNRTPFLKVKGQPGPFSAADLGVCAARGVLQHHSHIQQAIDEVITGCVMPSADEANIARIISLRLGLPNNVPAYTVQRNCASGLQAIDNAYQSIQMGRSDLVLAGGTEAMSRAPLLFSDDMAHWLGAWMKAKSLGKRLKLLSQLRPKHFKPIIALLKGLKDPVTGLSMGQTAEEVAYRFGISREAMDEFALESHQAVVKAQQEGYFEDIMQPVFAANGHYVTQDEGVRPDTNKSQLAKLSPYFDKPFGSVTAGNSSQITDGAAFLMLASEQAVDKYQLPVKASINAVSWAALDPKVMGLGPVHAVNNLLQEQQLQLNDIDCWEINEAFAGQVLGCLNAFADDDYCRQNLQQDAALGHINRSRLNQDGGAIALGHPVGASGARIMMQLVNIMQREQYQKGIASICIGGGQGGAALVESV